MKKPPAVEVAILTLTAIGDTIKMKWKFSSPLPHTQALYRRASNAKKILARTIMEIQKAVGEVLDTDGE